MDTPCYAKHYEFLEVLPIMMLYCGWLEAEIQHQDLGVCGGGVLCSGSMGIFRLMFGCLLSSLHPPSFPFFPSAFSLFCLQSFRARDMKTSRSKSRSFCLTGSDSKGSSVTGWWMAEVEERGWVSGGREFGKVEGETVWGDWGGTGEVGDEGRSEGREL